MTDSEAEQIVIWYQSLEAQLGGFLKTVPLTDKNHDIYLPLLAPLMVEAGSLIDTIFRGEYPAQITNGKKPSLTIHDFALHFERQYRLSEVKSLLFQYPPRYFEPFKGWTSAKTGNYVEKKWWKSYNNIKHNRIEKYDLATLGETTDIVCALQQVISALPTFTRALWRHDFLHARFYTHSIGQDIEKSSIRDAGIVETSLFATPIGHERFPTKIGDIEAFFFGGNRLGRFLGKG